MNNQTNNEINPALPELFNSSEFLNDQQLSTLIGGIGNNEGKALLLVAMATGGSAYTSRPLHGLITGLPGMDSVEAGSIYTQKGWCQSSIGPAGLVENHGSDGTQVTSLGLRLGVPLAGLLLNHADKYDVPLVELFGETRSSSEVPSQFIRLRIMEELLTHPGGMQLGDLVTSTYASNQVVIEKQLRKLANADLITYDDWDSATCQIRYEVPSESRSSLADKAGFTGTIAEYLLQASETSHDQVVNYCIQTVPGFNQLDPRAQSAKVSVVMFNLKRQGLVQKLEGKERPFELDVSLTPEQLEQWTDLCNKLESFKNQEPEVLAKWTKVAFDFITDPAKVRRAYERFRDSSARANHIEKNLGSIVLNALQDSGGSASVREVVKLASDRRGNSVSHFGVVRVLNHLAAEGLVNRHQDKVVMFSKR